MSGAVATGTVDELAERSAAASAVWARHVRPAAERDRRLLFGPLAGEPFAEGVETIYEGYLVHHGAGRAFAPQDAEQALLLGDHLYATGLAAICAAGDVEAIAALARLVAVCAHLRAEPSGTAEGDDARLWIATARHLAGPRTAAHAEACAALLAGDPGPLRALVPDAAAQALVEAHRELASA